MKVAMVLIMSFMLLSCGTDDYETGVRAEHIQDNAVRTYLQNFKALLGYGEIDVTIEMTEDFSRMHNSTNETVLAICIHDESKIEINKESWEELDLRSREILVFHELGHCFGKIYKHDDSLRRNGIPASIMFPSLLPAGWYAKYKELYIQDLSFKVAFSRSNPGGATLRAPDVCAYGSH